MSEEHMQGCGALRCTFYLPHAGYRCGITKELHNFDAGHSFNPGPCSCIVGELRAEIERLKEQMFMNEEKNDPSRP